MTGLRPGARPGPRRLEGVVFSALRGGSNRYVGSCELLSNRGVYSAMKLTTREEGSVSFRDRALRIVLAPVRGT